MEQTLGSPTPTLARLRELCQKAGLDLDRVSPWIVARMELLARSTETVSDSERCAALAEDIFRYVDKAKPSERFSLLERRTVVIGTLFSDIGKTGPAEASADGQQLVADMFSVEHVLDSSMSVTRFFETYFPADVEQRAYRFRRLGLDADMTMRDFWNLHSAWTLRILRGDGVPPEAVGAAATHHILENINPDAIMAEDGRLSRYLGENAYFDRSEKLVILLDKYDAARRRGKLTHAETIDWLRDLIAKNARFRGDSDFAALIATLDIVAARRESSQYESEESGTRPAISPRLTRAPGRTGTDLVGGS